MILATPAIIQLAYNPVLGGILSSACFGMMSSIYLLCLRQMRNVSLKSLIPSSDSNVAVVCPAGSRDGNPSEEARMTSEEAIVRTRARQLYYDFRGRDFAIQLETHPSLGYQGFPKRHQNISAEVFASQVGQPRRRQLTARKRNPAKGLQHAG